MKQGRVNVVALGPIPCPLLSIQEPGAEAKNPQESHTSTQPSTEDRDLSQQSEHRTHLGPLPSPHVVLWYLSHLAYNLCSRGCEVSGLMGTRFLKQ